MTACRPAGQHWLPGQLRNAGTQATGAGPHSARARSRLTACLASSDTVIGPGLPLRPPRVRPFDCVSLTQSIKLWPFLRATCRRPAPAPFTPGTLNGILLALRVAIAPGRGTGCRTQSQLHPAFAVVATSHDTAEQPRPRHDRDTNTHLQASAVRWRRQSSRKARGSHCILEQEPPARLGQSLTCSTALVDVRCLARGRQPLVHHNN